MKHERFYLATLLCFCACCIHAGIVSITSTATSTLTVANSTQTQTNSTQFVIPANVTAQIRHLHEYNFGYAAQGTTGGSYSGGGYLLIRFNNLNFRYTESAIATANSQPFVVGPATINLISSATCSTSGTGGNPYNATAQDNMVCTIETNSVSTNIVPVIPVNSVVIPSDATGPVQIMLESSSDLVNWISSQAGTYGSTYTNRFFRVRAIAQ